MTPAELIGILRVANGEELAEIQRLLGVPMDENSILSKFRSLHPGAYPGTKLNGEYEPRIPDRSFRDGPIKIYV